MKTKAKLQGPGRFELALLGWRTRRSARKEAAAATPGKQSDKGIVRTKTPAFQRLVTSKLIDSWLPALGASAARMFTRINARLETLVGLRTQLTEDLAEARQRLTEAPKIKLDLWTQMAIVLATVLGMITTWPFIQSLEAPLPIALLASLALAAFEVALSALFGWSLHALVKDEHDSQFALTFKESRFFLACTLCSGTISVSAAIYLASIRGEGHDQLIWLILGVGQILLGAYCGAALHDNKFEQSLRVARKRLNAVSAEITDCQNTFRSTAKLTMATGRRVCGSAAQINHRAETAFVKRWRTGSNRRSGAVVPSLAEFDEPSDAYLWTTLVMQMYDVGDGQVLYGDEFFEPDAPTPLYGLPEPS